MKRDSSMTLKSGLPRHPTYPASKRPIDQLQTKIACLIRWPLLIYFIFDVSDSKLKARFAEPLDPDCGCDGKDCANSYFNYCEPYHYQLRLALLCEPFVIATPRVAQSDILRQPPLPYPCLLVVSMGRGIFVYPILLNPNHAAAAGHSPLGAGPVEWTTLGPVAEGLGAIAPL